MVVAENACGRIFDVHAVELPFRHRMGGLLDLLAGGSLLHETGTHRLVARLRIRAVILSSSIVLLIHLGALSRITRQHRIRRAPGSGSPSSRSDWRSRSGLASTSGATGAPRCRRRTEPELVTSGPYRLVRHPIYSGILVAGIGTAVALSWSWLIAVALAGIYFIYSATVEERYLTSEFPDAYPAYRRSTKMLVPFIF